MCLTLGLLFLREQRRKERAENQALQAQQMQQAQQQMPQAQQQMQQGQQLNAPLPSGAQYQQQPPAPIAQTALGQ
jgi:hypothetical protein